MRRRTPAAPKAAPPDRGRAWTAEIEWRELEDGARFVVVAVPASSGRAATIAETPTLAWPPADRGSVRALGSAAADLEGALVRAGWAPAGRGRAWYAKRFAWEPDAHTAEPAPAPSAAPETAALFAPRPRWPDATAGRWRCEIGWQAGWARSRFRAVAYAPGVRRGCEVRASGPLPGLLMAQPSSASADHRRELDGLTVTLTDAGWEPAGTGGGWYARRFYWPGDAAPPVRSQSAGAY
jgi:hypothetical protein